MGTRNWKPLVSGALAKQVNQTIDQVGTALLHSEPTPDLKGKLMFGDLGRALALSYLEKARPGAGYGEKAQTLLQDAFDEISEVLEPRFFGGLAGLGWAAENISSTLGDDPPDSSDLLDTLSDLIEEDPEWLVAEYLHGITGFANFARECKPQPAADRLLRATTKWLAEKFQQPGGWIWNPESSPYAPAHGLAGPVSLLCAAHQTFWAPPDEGRLILRSAQALEATYRQTLHRTPPLAWCMGELGVTVVLHKPSVQRHVELHPLSTSLYARTLERLKDKGVSALHNGDTSLCHGVGGGMHMLNLLFQQTGEQRWGDYAQQAVALLLEMRRGQEGVGGYGLRSMDDDRPLPASFLFGASGVLLALLACVSETAPQWDRALLLSDPEIV